MAEEIFQQLSSSVIAHDKQKAIEITQKGIDNYSNAVEKGFYE